MRRAHRLRFTSDIAQSVTLTIFLLLALSLTGLALTSAPATPTDAVRRTWGEPTSHIGIHSARAFPRVHLVGGEARS